MLRTGRRCQKPGKKTNTNVHVVSCSNSNSDQEDSLVANIGTNHVNKLDVTWIHLKVAGRNLRLELDTGSAVSVISLCEYSKLYKHLRLKNTAAVLRTFTGEQIKPKGKPCASCRL